MSGSYTIKRLEARISLASGSFSSASASGGAYNTKIYTLGMDASVNKPGGKEKNSCTLTIQNVPMRDMEQLTTLAFEPLKTSRKNRLALYAGDQENGLTLVFSGDILTAAPDFNRAPDPTLNISAVTGYVASITPTVPLTWKGDQDVAQTLQRLATQMGLTFKNRGVAVRLRNAAWVGGPMEQARQIADAARIAMIVDDDEMIIAPPGVMREDEGGQTPVWKDNTGMIGYPSFSNDGIEARGLYEPKCKIGGPIRIESIVPKASGLWRIVSLTHELSANYGGAGRWDTSVKGAPAGAKTKGAAA